jgi:hypothetical protein
MKSDIGEFYGNCYNFDADFCMSAYSLFDLLMEPSLSFSTVALLTGSGKNHKHYEAPDL